MKRFSVLLPAALCGMLILGICAGVRRVVELARVPAFASVDAIELRYARQINRLCRLAEDSGMLSRHYTNNEIDRSLFGSPEILDASIKTGPHSYRSVFESDYGYRTRRAYVYFEPKLGEAVVNRLYDATDTGQQIEVVEYRRAVANDKGELLEIHLLFSLDGLRDAQHTTGPNKMLDRSGDYGPREWLGVLVAARSTSSFGKQ
jgi:hypothetical protein